MPPAPSRLAAADVDVSAARAWVEENAGVPVAGVANVLVDGSGRLGALSYLVPDGTTVTVGDAVEVPFGKRQAYGMVLGPGDPELATRSIDQRFGSRADATEIAVAQLVARRHFTDVWRVAARLSPTTGKGAEPVTDWDVVLDDRCPDVPVPELGPRPDDVVDVVRRFAARPPGVDDAAYAARIAHRLSDGGQVLVLCPTTDLVKRVVACFDRGASRIDTKATRGAWKGFNSGTVRVGVGTRTAALYSAPELAAIVVVEQDHPGHVEMKMPNTHARDVAMLRSLLCDVPVVFTGAVPTPTSLTAGVKLVEPDGGWPRMVLATRDGHTGTSRLLPPAALRELRDARAAGITPLVLVERARAIHRCGRCNARRDHDGCESAAICDHRFDPCGDCGEQATRPVGWDADRLDQLMHSRATPVGLKELAEARDAGLVVIFDIEPSWRRPVLDPDVQAAHVIATAARAAGPDGTVVVIAADDSRPTLQAMCQQSSQRALALHLWEVSRTHRLPPFGRLVTIRVGRTARPKVAGWPGQVLGPRRVGGEWEILVVIDPADLHRLEAPLERLRRPGKVRVTVT